MKISHSDQVTSHSFQWSCVSYENKQKPHSEYGPSTDKKTKTIATSVPRNRFHHASCMYGRYLYVYGGKDRYSPLKDFWRLDTVYQTWEEIEETKSKLPHLQGHTMVAYKSQLLIFGGTFHDSQEEIPLWIYNPDLSVLRKWYEPSVAQPSGRREHSAVVYKNSMFIYGGFLDNSGSTDEFWAFDIDEEEWVNVHHKKPGKRHGHAAVVFSNSMWLHGGMKELTALSDLWTYHFSLCKWSRVKGLGLCPTLSNHTAHVTDNTLLLVGGSRHGAVVHDIWAFNFETESWKQLTFDHCDTYPCVSLHTSVVLRLSAVHDTKDRTQSVPQLKSKGIVREEMARPMTSPPQLNYQDNKYQATSNAGNHQMDALDNFCLTNLDEVLNIEAETSFSCCDADQKDRHPAVNVLNVEEIRHQSESSGKIAPTCVEHSRDNIPLLQRFHSVLSDVEWGENNLSLTISDENIDGREEKTFGSLQCVDHSTLSNANCDTGNRWATLTHKHFQKTRNKAGQASDKKEFVLQNFTNYKESSKNSFVNPFYMDLYIESSQLKYDLFFSSTQSHCSPKLRSKYDNKDVVLVEDLTVESKFDDLKIEDLELCDVDQLFINQSPYHSSPPQSRLVPDLGSYPMENSSQLAPPHNIKVNHATKQDHSPSPNCTLPKQETIHAFSAELAHDVSFPADQDLATSKHHSIGTQTQDFQVPDTQEPYYGFTSPLASCNTSSLPSSHSIMGDSELCLLVLGGQTEDPTFKTEPLKLWKCHIY